MTNDRLFSPREAWRQRVGGIQSRNTLVCDGPRLYIGTCGETWNVRDSHDGVFCLNRTDGNILWFTPTTADVNEISLAGSSLLAPTDAGDVFVLDASSGKIIAVYRADSPVLGSPLVTEGVGGWSAVFASLAGTIYLIQEHSQNLVALGKIGGRIRASLVRLAASEFLAATENGKLIKCTMRGQELKSHELVAVPPDLVWGDEVYITATPLHVGTKIFAGFVRSTYGDDPAVFCFDLESESVDWVASSRKDVSLTFGNVRATPALVGDKLVIASAYTDGVDILDAHNGNFLQRIVLGQNTFQQWSSPVPAGENRVALGRVDGVCSIVDVVAGTLAASISLTTAETERRAKANADDPREGENFTLYPGEAAPDGAICGSPLVDGDMLFVGTTDGVLVGVRLFS